MEETALYNFCVSTLVDRKRLGEFALTGRGKFTEVREWKTVASLFEEARKNGERFPVILSDACASSKSGPRELIGDFEPGAIGCACGDANH
jgi:hypothetical protein